MKAAIFGTGKMGQPIAWGMEKLGYNLIVSDSSIESLETCSNILEEYSNHQFVHYHDTSISAFEFVEGVDVVISALPYHATEKLAKHCIVNGIRYCDLGGSVKVSKSINDFAKDNGKKPIMTDLGLAPGWINILTEHVYHMCVSKKDGTIPTTIKMMVGGIPTNPSNTLKYNVTWSIDGLINEYKEDSLILEKGVQQTHRSMAGLERVSTRLGELEAFYTSGGISNTLDVMQNRGVDNCYYKTLRWKGHCDLVNSIVAHEGWGEFRGVVEETCLPLNDSDDLIIMRVMIDDWIEENIIKSNEKWSAMQRATAFPIVSVANIMAGGFCDSFSSFSYEDIPYNMFNGTLDKLFN